MKERPILFAPANIRSILAGHKTQTRKVASEFSEQHEEILRRYPHQKGCLYGVPGDRLWVREGIVKHASIPQLVGYRADGCKVTEPWEKNVTAMFMPKWAARIWLEITGVRVERVQSISEEDAMAEGVHNEGGAILDHFYETGEIKTGYSALGRGTFPTARAGYEFMWNAINGKKHPWSANPWVWVLAFKRVER